MTKHEKITEAISSQNVIDCCKRVVNNDLYKDVLADIYIYIYELDNEKFEAINDLKSYICKIIYFSWKNPTNKIHKKYIDRSEEITSSLQVFETDETPATDELNRIENDIEQDRCAYEVKLLDMYMELGSYRKVGKLVNINAMTVYKIINGLTGKIKQNI